MYVLELSQTKHRMGLTIALRRFVRNEWWYVWTGPGFGSQALAAVCWHIVLGRLASHGASIFLFVQMRLLGQVFRKNLLIYLILKICEEILCQVSTVPSGHLPQTVQRLRFCVCPGSIPLYSFIYCSGLVGTSQWSELVSHNSQNVSILTVTDV